MKELAELITEVSRLYQLGLESIQLNCCDKNCTPSNPVIWAVDTRADNVGA